MKRIVKVLILFALIISVLLTCTSCAVGKYNLKRYFDEWESEVDMKVYPTYDRAILRLENELFDVRDYVQGDIGEVYCIYQNQVFFSYYKLSPKGYPKQNWGIGSVSLNGENFQSYFFEDITDAESSLDVTYHQFAKLSEGTIKQGGMFLDGKIYLQGKNRVIVYDVQTNTITEMSESPRKMYKWTKENNQLTIEHIDSKISKIITIEKMAENNAYADQILDLTSKKIIQEGYLNETFFSLVIQKNEEIYITCSVFDCAGNEYALVFQYDFETEDFSFVTYCHLDGSCVDLFSFVPVLSS